MRHRPRTGRRRDPGLRVIRTDEVRYPGHDEPVPETPEPEPAAPAEPQERQPTSLGPVRDTGFALGEGRRQREGLRKRRARQQRIAAVAVIVAFGALLAYEFATAYTANASHARAKLLSETAVPAVGATSSPAPSANTAAEFPTRSATSMQAAPTPVFAHLGSLLLRLPVPVSAVTEIGFHQASYTYAMHMKSNLPDANMNKAFHHGTRSYSSSPLDSTGELDMTVLRMWRARPGKPDSAADVGALPGTPVLAPVTGTVLKVKPYQLYGRYFDYEIHIRPDGFRGEDVVLIHIDHPSVKAGDPVLGGVTQLGVVRLLSNRLHDQLADYERPGPAHGDHVHIQVNNVNDPSYHGLDGVTD